MVAISTESSGIFFVSGFWDGAGPAAPSLGGNRQQDGDEHSAGKGRHGVARCRAPAGAAPCPIYHSDAAADRAGRCSLRPRSHARRRAHRPSPPSALVLEDAPPSARRPSDSRRTRRRPGPAMAGHDQRDRVGGAGPRHRPRRGRPANRVSNLLVGAHLAIRNRPQRAPHLLLERGAPDVDRWAVLVPDASCRRIAATCAPGRVRPGQLGAGNSAARSASSAPASSPSMTRQTPRLVAATSSCPNGVGVTMARMRSRRRPGGRRRGSCPDGDRPVRRRRG